MFQKVHAEDWLPAIGGPRESGSHNQWGETRRFVLKDRDGNLPLAGRSGSVVPKRATVATSRWGLGLVLHCLGSKRALSTTIYSTRPVLLGPFNLPASCDHIPFSQQPTPLFPSSNNISSSLCQANHCSSSKHISCRHRFSQRHEPSVQLL